MSKKQFNQQQKLAILKSAENLSIRDAADIAGIHYTTIYDGVSNLKPWARKHPLNISHPNQGVGLRKLIRIKNRQL